MRATSKEKIMSIWDWQNHGLYCRKYRPGDGVTRYRFFTSPSNDYFGPENGIYTALGWKEAEIFATGFILAK
jgi:hypothetical protein